MLNKQEMIRPLGILYQKLTTQLADEERYVVFRHVVGFVENTDVVSTNAFLLFTVEEDARMII